jgi:TonB family protein
VIAGLRVAGETQVRPSEVTKTEVLRDGKHQLVATFEICLDDAGRVASANQLASTHYPAYDAQLADAVRAWQYRPYTANGAAMPVCGVVTFVYTMQ